MAWPKALAAISGKAESMVIVAAAGAQSLAMPNLAEVLSKLTHEPWLVTYQYHHKFGWDQKPNLEQMLGWLDGRPALISTEMPKNVVSIRDGKVHGWDDCSDMMDNVSVVVMRFSDLPQLEQERTAGIVARYSAFLPDGIEAMPYDPMDDIAKAMQQLRKFNTP